MKKIPIWIWVLLFFAALISAKMVFFPKKTDDKQAKSAMGKSDKPTRVNYTIAQKETIENEIYTTGSVGALNEIEVKPEVAGKITAIYFKEGSFISKGSPLVKINDAELQAQLQRNLALQNLSFQKTERLKKLLAANGVSKEELESQVAEGEVLRAEESLLKAQIAKTVVIAPFSGTIGLKSISEGSYISPSQSIATLIQTNPVYIEFSLPEQYAAVLKNTQLIHFKTDANQPLTASIYAKEPKIDEETKTIKARAIYQGNESLVPGSFVKVMVNLGQANSSIMIPTEAIVPILNGQKVFIAQDGIVVEKTVKTGVRTESKIQIIDGLSVGDTVITSGILTMKKDAKVILIQSNK